MSNVKIMLMGLGVSDEHGLSREAWDWLQGYPKLVVLSSEHPALVKQMDLLNIIKVLPVSKSANGVKHLVTPAEIAQQVIELARIHGEITFAVAGSPLLDSAACQQLIQLAEEASIDLRVIDGVSLVSATASVLGKGFVPSAVGWMDASEILAAYHPQMNPCQAWIIKNVQDEEAASQLTNRLKSVYPANMVVSIVNLAAQLEQQVRHCEINSLPQSGDWGALTIVYIPPVGQEGSFESFQNLIAHLRAPNGCPWDREQTHLTLRSHLIEEAYETLDAIDSQKPEALREELGDLLLQIVLHAQIAFENQDFSMLDVLQGIQRKLIYRHPHVFGDEAVEGSGTVLRNWEKLKESERAANGQSASKGLLDGVPNAMPALSQAQKFQERAARVGFDWDEVSGVLDKLVEEIGEFQSAAGVEDRQIEMGDILFSLVNLARWYDIDAESALRATNLKFKRRFSYVETKAKENGQNLSDMSLPEMDAYWDESKHAEG